MRCVAGVGLLMLVGCNRIFGISETQPWDAPPPVHYATLTWQLATTASDGKPATSLSYPAFAAGKAPQIRIASADGAFAAVAYESDGRIMLPPSFFGDEPTFAPMPWRLEYQLAPRGMTASPPHEVQWVPDDKVGHVVVPIVGRLDRGTVPMGGGYRVTPTNPPASYTAPRIWTTGLWSDGLANPSGTTIDYDFANATWLSGDNGPPDPAQGDRAYAVDFIVDPGTQCRVAVGGAGIDSPAIAANTHTDESVSWDTKRQPISSTLVDLGFIQRLAMGLVKLHGSFNSAGSGLLYGAAPSTVAPAPFPGLTGSSPVFPLPIPVMLPVVQCPFNINPLPAAALPGKLGDFPLVLHVQLVDSRKVGTINFYSGLETVITLSSGTFTVAFPAAMPTRPTLATSVAAAPLDLAGDADQIAAGTATGPLLLAFVPEAGLDPPDYYDVLLHKLDGDTLTTERIYTVSAPQVRIDPSVFVGGAEYVFEIRSFKGHPLAARGDFTLVQYPYGSAVVFTRTFKIQ